MKGLKRPWLAALLNLIPFIGLASCTANALHAPVPLGFTLIFTIFIWDLGYAYLGRWFRFLLALAFPWVFGWIPNRLDPALVWNRGLEYITPFILIYGSACLITAVDAWRLAKQQNAKLLVQRAAGSGPPQSIGSRQ